MSHKSCQHCGHNKDDCKRLIRANEVSTDKLSGLRCGEAIQVCASLNVLGGVSVGSSLIVSNDGIVGGDFTVNGDLIVNGIIINGGPPKFSSLSLNSNQFDPRSRGQRSSIQNIQSLSPPQNQLGSFQETTDNAAAQGSGSPISLGPKSGIYFQQGNLSQLSPTKINLPSIGNYHVNFVANTDRDYLNSADPKIRIYINNEPQGPIGVASLPGAPLIINGFYTTSIENSTLEIKVVSGVLKLSNICPTQISIMQIGQ